MGPAKLGELETVVAFLQRADEEDEAYDVEHEADEAMMRCEGEKDFVHQNDVFEVIYDAFAIEVVHGGCKEIPVQGFGQWKVLSLCVYGRDGNDFFKGDYLYSGYDGDDVDMSCEHGCEKASYHDQCPYRTCDKGLLLLFVLGGH